MVLRRKCLPRRPRVITRPSVRERGSLTPRRGVRAQPTYIQEAEPADSRRVIVNNYQGSGFNNEEFHEQVSSSSPSSSQNGGVDVPGLAHRFPETTEEE
jgi:hypothetical protein